MEDKNVITELTMERRISSPLPLTAKFSILQWICAVMLFLTSSSTFSASGDKYVIAKFGFMSIDVENASSLLTLGGMFGYGFNQNMSVEGEINYGFSGGTYENTESNIKGEFRIGTFAAYGVYRLALGQSAYLKVKGGAHKEYIKLKTQALKPGDPTTKKVGDTLSQDTGFAGGLGIGGRLDNNLTMELELTGIDQRIRLLSLGMHYSF